MLVRVRAVAEFETIVVTSELQRGRHLLVGERPVAELVVEIVRSVLEEHAQRAWSTLADECRVDVPAADIREAADMADDLAEDVRPLPRDGERADAAGAGARDRVHRRVGDKVVEDRRHAVITIQRDVLMRQEIYTALAQTLEQARIEEVRAPVVLNVIESADLPVEPQRQEALRTTLIGLCAGILVGMVLAVLRQRVGEKEASLA